MLTIGIRPLAARFIEQAASDNEGDAGALARPLAQGEIYRDAELRSFVEYQRHETCRLSVEFGANSLVSRTARKQDTPSSGATVLAQAAAKPP